jgi:hypothetical protein
MKTKALTSILEHPAVAAKRAEVEAVNERLKQAVQREAAARARLRERVASVRTDDVPLETKKARAKGKIEKLLAGGTVSAMDPADDLQAALAEQDILHAAQVELGGELHELVATVSHEVTLDYLQPAFKVDTIELYEHLARAAAVMMRMRDRTADAIRAGYHLSSGSLPDLVPRTAWALGDPGDFCSQLAKMRRDLVAQGWIK